MDNLYDDVSTSELNNIQITETAVQKLTNKYREVIELRYWSDLPFNDIAKLLKTKEVTIKVRHHRAIKQLKKIIEEQEKNEI